MAKTIEAVEAVEFFRWVCKSCVVPCELIARKESREEPERLPDRCPWSNYGQANWNRIPTEKD